MAPLLDLDIDRISEALCPVLTRERSVCAAYVFGSVSRGDPNRLSDVDLGLLFEDPPPLGELLRLEQQFDDALGCSTDVVDLGSASAFLALDIVKGRRIFCRNPDDVDEFELFVLRRAGDLAPFERARRALLLGATV